MKVVASIHGRFQPFHNGHLEYFSWAKARSEKIFVGITQIYGEDHGTFPGAQHRGFAENNPFSYFERARIVEASLLQEGFSLADFRIVPFPIEDIDRLHHFVPRPSLCFTTVHSEWNRHKIEVLENAGYSVQVLNQDESAVSRASGTEIRRLLREGDPSWKMYVPAGAQGLIDAEFLDRFHTPSR